MLARFATASLAVLTLALAGTLAGGCDGGSDGGSADASEILIGHVASLNGDTATFGTSADEGIKLAVEEINAAGGVLGKKIVIKTEDDRSLPDEAKTAANKLITRDKVVALLGEIASNRSLAMAPEAQAAGVPMLSPGSTNPRSRKWATTSSAPASSTRSRERRWRTSGCAT